MNVAILGGGLVYGTCNGKGDCEIELNVTAFFFFCRSRKEKTENGQSVHATRRNNRVLLFNLHLFFFFFPPLVRLSKDGQFQARRTPSRALLFHKFGRSIVSIVFRPTSWKQRNPNHLHPSPPPLGVRACVRVRVCVPPIHGMDAQCPSCRGRPPTPFTRFPVWCSIDYSSHQLAKGLERLPVRGDLLLIDACTRFVQSFFPRLRNELRELIFLSERRGEKIVVED